MVDGIGDPQGSNEVIPCVVGLEGSSVATGPSEGRDNRSGEDADTEFENGTTGLFQAADQYRDVAGPGLHLFLGGGGGWLSFHSRFDSSDADL